MKKSSSIEQVEIDVLARDQITWAVWLLMLCEFPDTSKIAFIKEDDDTILIAPKHNLIHINILNFINVATWLFGMDPKCSVVCLCLV